MKRLRYFSIVLLFVMFGCSGTTVTDNTSSNSNQTTITSIDEDDIVVYFETNGGSSVSPLVNPEWTDILNLPLSVKDGFILEGWYEDEDLTEEFDIGWIGELTTTTLYAKWAAIDNSVIIVSLVLNSGIAPYDNVPMYEEHQLDITITPERQGYTFRGWFYDENLTEHYDKGLSFDGDSTLYAGWVEGDYTLIYNEEDFIAIADDLDGNYLLMDWLAFPGPAFRSDIDEYTTIGDAEHPFSGILDGNNWSVSIQYILMDFTSENIGLFGVITGTVRNLELNIWNEFNPYTMNESFNFGGLAGTIKGTVEDSLFIVEQSFNLNDITGEINIGAIAGIIDGGNIRNTIISTGNSDIIIDNSGLVSGNQEINVGMICGRTSDSNFENIAVNGYIDVSDEYTTSADVVLNYAFGGAIGKAVNATLEWVFNEETWSEITPTIFNYANVGQYYVGGLIAYAVDCEMDMVYSWEGVYAWYDISGTLSLGGLLGYAENCVIENAYVEAFVGMSGTEFDMNNSISNVGGIIGYAKQCSINNIARGGDTKINDIGEGVVNLAGFIATSEGSSISNVYMYANMISVYCLVDKEMITIAYMIAENYGSSLSNVNYIDGIWLILNFESVPDTGHGNAIDYDVYENFIDEFLSLFEDNDWYNNVYDADIY